MVQLQQISALLGFLEGHPELALGNCSRTNEGRHLTNRRWVECAQILNSVAPNCPTKSPAEWRSFYNEYKCKVMKKIKLQKSKMNATGEDPAKKVTLTPLQERLYDILGRNNGEPLASLKTENSDVPLNDQTPRRCHQSLKRCYPGEDHAASHVRLEQNENARATLEHAQATNNLAAAIDRLGATTNQATDRLAAAVEKIGDMMSLFISSASHKKRRCKIIIVSSDSNSDSDSDNNSTTYNSTCR